MQDGGEPGGQPRVVEPSLAGPGGGAEEAVQSSEKGKPLQGVRKEGHGVCFWWITLAAVRACGRKREWKQKEVL